MKNVILFGIAVLFCISAFCDECWSDGFRFDGSEITEEAILLNPTDPLAYSSALAEGEPKSLTINVEDTFDPEKSASIFADYSETAVEGTAAWDYTDEDFKDFPTDDTYLLTETVTSDTESKVLKRTVTILPEPIGLLVIAIIGVLFLRKRTKSLMAILAIATLGALSAKADGCVSNVNCLQMWPFDRSVIINYTLTSNSTNPIFDVKFYGSTDDGVTIFDLAEKGTITRDGANGTVAGSGEHKTIWSPDESFYETFSDDMLVKVEATEQNLDGTYMIIDLSGGTNATNFAISYLDDVPEGGWTDEYKTTKMVLRKIKPGSFTMGSPSSELGRKDDEVQRKITLTQPFYIGVFEATQKQYELITGFNPSHHKGETRPVEYVSYNMIRGEERGTNWPANCEVDATAFLGILRAKTNHTFDLPTEAQWEFACRAETLTAWNDGTTITNEVSDGNLARLGRYSHNREDGFGGFSEHTIVGSYLPNDWGLYDMHGNVYEWCLDWYDLYSGDTTDPKGKEDGYCRVCRGGCFGGNARYCRSAERFNYWPGDCDNLTGFRIALTVSNEPAPAPDPEKYLVIDLSGGTNATNFAISYLDDVPEGGWTDEYKTTKMVLRKIKAGKFLMGSPTNEFGRSGDETQHKVTLTKDFYIGVFETTQTQYKLIAGVNPSLYGGDMRPVDSVSYDTLRGANRGSKWPSSSRVDASSFFGILRAKTGKAFDLPTEAQWEYACRAGTTTALNNGCSITNYYADGNLNKLGRYQGNGGRDEDVPFTKNAHVIVGSYLPNAWGLYDMHGNVDEWCLDWHLQYSGDATDPKGPDGYSRCRVMRGGNWFSGPHMCRSAFRSTYDVPENGSEMTGVRIVLVP